MHRSIFRLIHPYNVLPQVVVNLKTVKSFQRQLHVVMKKCANEGIPNWEIFLHRGIHLRGVTFSVSCFVIKGLRLVVLHDERDCSMY